jgi:CO/xanthine dehydrogenase Mo-binding subunit
MAAGFWGNGGGPASAIASVLPDGSISLVEGSPDIGGTRVVAAMHVAEVLGIAAEDVHPSIGDTDSIGFTSLTGGSSVAFKTGWAAYTAAQDVKQQLVQRAARIWGILESEVTYANGVLSNASDDRQLTLKELAARLNETGGPVMGRATVSPRSSSPAYAFHIADVEVDPETGKVQVLRYTAIQDAGRAIHPSYVEGQMQGGAAQGIGWALNEEFVYDAAGRMLNSSFLDYRMPTALDVPLIETQIIEVPNPGHPYGVRGVGEVPIVPPLAAIANAVYRATGVRFHELPMSPGRILEATNRIKD